MWTTSLMSRAEFGALLPILQPKDKHDELHRPTTSSILLQLLPIRVLQPGDINLNKLAGDAAYHSYLRVAGAATSSTNYVPDSDDAREWNYYDAYNHFHPTSASSSQPRYLGT